MAKAPETLNLVPAIREVEAQIHRLTVEFEEKIKPYNDSLAALKKANTAYRLAKTMNEAKRNFKAVMGDWMKIISARLIPPGEEAESILTNPIRVPL